MEKRQLGGIGFLVCNAALFTNGLIAHLMGATSESRQAGSGRMASALLWSGSGFFLAKYGDRSVDAQQARLEEKLADYLRKEGVPLDAATLRKADHAARHGWFKKIEDFFYAHPIECENAYNALAATGFAVSGALRLRDGDVQAGKANLGQSALMLVGALATIIIPEKTPAQIAAKGQSGTLWGKVQQKPLAYTRGLLVAGDLMNGFQARGEYRAAMQLPQGDRYRKGLFAMSGLSVAAMGTAIFSDVMTSGSKKAGGTPEARSAAQQAIITAAANHIAALPPAQQQHLATATADYLIHQKELRFQDRHPEELAVELLQTLSLQPRTHIAATQAQVEKLPVATPSMQGRLV